jgi:hypothetical protein
MMVPGRIGNFGSITIRGDVNAALDNLDDDIDRTTNHADQRDGKSVHIHPDARLVQQDRNRNGRNYARNDIVDLGLCCQT